MKNKVTDPAVKNKIVSCKKSQKKCCICLKKLTCRRFTLNKKSVYLNIICKKRIITKPVLSEHAM